MTKQTKCSERVGAAWESERETLRCMMQPKESDVVLCDDGSMDTVVAVDGNEMRFCSEDAADYRDESGELWWVAFVSDHWHDICDNQWELFSEHGLAFEHVQSKGCEPDYFRYLISTGGPGTEIRFYANVRFTGLGGDPEFSLVRAEFWLLDWFEGASVDVTSDEVVEALWDHFEETDGVLHAWRGGY